MSRHGETMEFSRWPLVLPHADIKRILTRNTRLLILSRSLNMDAYEVHNGRVIRDNLKHKRNGRDDLQEDPAVCLIEIADVDECGLLDLDLASVNRAGFDSFEDFYREWLKRRRRVVPALEVKLYSFTIIDALYLDQRVHRGYTRNPAHAAQGEPPVVDRAHLDLFAEDARARYSSEHAEDVAKREARSRANRLKELQAIAVRKGLDISDVTNTIDTQLAALESKLQEAA